MDAFYIERSYKSTYLWAVNYGDKVLKTIGDTPISFFSTIYNLYNFSLKDLYKYLISKFHAMIFIEKSYPYYTILFSNKHDAEEWCKELNSRFEI